MRESSGTNAHPACAAVTSHACHTLDRPGPRSPEKVKNTDHAWKFTAMSGTLTAAHAATVPPAASRNGRHRRERTARISSGPRISSGYSFMAAPRPNSTPAVRDRPRDHAYMPHASRATAHRSQLMVPASTIPGATATMSPSVHRRPAIRTVSTATTAHSTTTNPRFTSQNTTVPCSGENGSACVIQAATEPTTDISTGYSNVEPARNGAHGSAANPRPP